MFQSNEYAEIEENDFAEFDFEDEADEFSQVITGIYILHITNYDIMLKQWLLSE